MIDTTELEVALDGVARLKKMVTRGLTELEKLAPTISALVEENAQFREEVDVMQISRDRLSEENESLRQANESYRTPEPCGHMKNFLIGDEHGHFTCLVCHNAALRAKLAPPAPGCIRCDHPPAANDEMCASCRKEETRDEELERLRAKLEAAPHYEFCASQNGIGSDPLPPCDCWKAAP